MQASSCTRYVADADTFKISIKRSRAERQISRAFETLWQAIAARAAALMYLHTVPT